VTPADAAIRDIVARHHWRITGNTPEIYFTDGYNEMDFLINDLNIPTVQYGPGDSGLCHTDEERLSIRQLLDATRVYVGIALEAAGDVRHSV
jgi:acetylornithine deacetylase/succinyl-diaminopimelate desuccinylase-like protein